MSSAFVREAIQPDSLESQREHLASMRHLNARKPQDENRAKAWPYSKAVLILFENVALDPERQVLDEWKPTPYDRMTSFKQDGSRPPGQQIDAGDGFGVVVKGRAPFKVRSLHRPSLGEVKEVNALEYWLLKQAEQNLTTPRWEPVPDETPVRGPLLPPGFPSSDAKARQIAAKGLRKPAEELTFKQILEYFQKRTKAPLESYGG